MHQGELQSWPCELVGFRLDKPRFTPNATITAGGEKFQVGSKNGDEDEAFAELASAIGGSSGSDRLALSLARPSHRRRLGLDEFGKEVARM